MREINLPDGVDEADNALVLRGIDHKHDWLDVSTMGAESRQWICQLCDGVVYATWRRVDEWTETVFDADGGELRAWLNEQHPRPWWQQAADWLWWHLGRIWR